MKAMICMLIIFVVAYLFRPMEKKGCLTHKTEQQLHDFFESLTAFKDTDPDFFWEQVHDLQQWELNQYIKWLERQNQKLRLHYSLLKAIMSMESNPNTSQL